MRFSYKPAVSVTVALAAAFGISKHAEALEFVTDTSSSIEYQQLISAGDPNGTPGDSPAQRVDPNTTSSLYGGVGSLFFNGKDKGNFLCTGTAISTRHILTAAHCLDLDNNGSVGFLPEDVTFNLNFGSDLSHRITASNLTIHPSYIGSGNSILGDDLAIITLGTNLPSEVPIYNLHRQPLNLGETLTMVGYGSTGSGVSGYQSGGSTRVKRVGKNNADVFAPDRRFPFFGSSPEKKAFIFDYDGPDASTNRYGGLTLGNDIEATLGAGDSGGPSFVWLEDSLVLAGVNTFTLHFRNQTPGTFGTVGGGMIVSSYLDWIDSVLSVTEISTSPIFAEGSEVGEGVVPSRQLVPASISVPEPSILLGFITLSLGLVLKRRQ
jgi:secreted trypsin-like serine protease